MKKLIILLTIFLMVFTSTGLAVFAADTGNVNVVNVVFTDVPQTHSYFVAISFLNKIGLFNGYKDGTFGPENPINRAEALKIIVMDANVELIKEYSQIFSDVGGSDWFASYVLSAKKAGLVNGNSDGTFAPARRVTLGEFLKMLFSAYKLDTTKVNLDNLAKNISKNAWEAPYIAYAQALGLIATDSEGKIYPNRELNRGEVANLVYLLMLIRNAKNTAFLLDRAQAEMLQIEPYVGAQQIGLSKVSSEVAVDLTQQALKNSPEDQKVLAIAKIAKAYNYLVISFMYGVEGKYSEATDYANKAISKATEAWEVDNSTQPIAKHIKDRSREILAQLENK